jgi:hypothetical protein
MLPPVETRLPVHVLIHRHEQARPSSTGRLVARVVTGAACHVYQRANRFFPASGVPVAVVEPGRDLWIRHPGGAPLPVSPVAGTTTSDTPQAILLLDGSWRQAGEMLRRWCISSAVGLWLARLLPSCGGGKGLSLVSEPPMRHSSLLCVWSQPTTADYLLCSAPLAK